MDHLNTQRYYLKDKTGRVVKFLHIQQLRQPDSNSIHIYLSGLNAKLPRLIKKHPSRRWKREELAAVNYRWKDFETVHEQSPIKYISFHPLDMCFRFQLMSGDSIERKFDGQHGLGRFIDFKIHSATPDQYRLVSLPKDKHTIINIGESQIAESHGSFALQGEDLRDHPVFKGDAMREGRDTTKPVRMIMGGSLLDLSKEARASRPDGIIFSVLLFLKDGSYVDESYLLA